MSNKTYQKELQKLSRTIKELRELFRLSQTRLAKLAGVSRGVIADIEQKKRFPSSLTLLKLCTVFEITPTELCATAFSDWQTGAPNNERSLLHKALHNSMDRVVTDAALSKFRKK